jgi:hypothetical protein
MGKRWIRQRGFLGCILPFTQIKLMQLDGVNRALVARNQEQMPLKGPYRNETRKEDSHGKRQR